MTTITGTCYRKQPIGNIKSVSFQVVDRVVASTVKVCGMSGTECIVALKPPLAVGLGKGLRRYFPAVSVQPFAVAVAVVLGILSLSLWR